MEKKAPKTAKKPVKRLPVKNAGTNDALFDKVEQLKEEAKRKGLLDSVLFEELLDDFYYQTNLLRRLRAEIDGGELTTQKTYVKGAPNTSPNKLIATYNATSNARVNTVGAIAKLVRSFKNDTEDTDDPLTKIINGGA